MCSLVLAGMCVHKLLPLAVDEAAMLLGKLVGQDVIRASNITLPKARSIVLAQNCFPGRIVQAAADLAARSRGVDGTLRAVDLSEETEPA